MHHAVVTHADWIAARMRLLEKERAFTRLRDELARERRELPWERVTKTYRFETPEGAHTLAELFGERSQLVVYHFMYGPDWSEGCKSCSFWADGFDRHALHLAQRDVNLVAISRAPLATLLDYRKRMGWSFRWVSSLGSDFNADYQVSFTDKSSERGPVYYNYAKREFGGTEAPGVSVFIRDDAGAVFHTYSTYARGLDMLNAAYQILDLVPKGRDEDALPYSMAWVRHRDKYPPAR